MTSILKVGDLVIHDGNRAEIIRIINTKEEFKSAGSEDPLLVELGFNDIPGDFEQYMNDSTNFPMIIIKYITKSVFNESKMYSWMYENNLIKKFEGWLAEDDDSTNTSERKNKLSKLIQFHQFKRRYSPDIKTPDLYDRGAIITPDERDDIEFLTADKLKSLVLSGGRSRKKKTPISYQEITFSFSFSSIKYDYAKVKINIILL
jgi:hypothetical protein